MQIIVEDGAVITATFSIVDTETGRKIGDPIHAQEVVRTLEPAAFVAALDKLLQDKATLVAERKADDGATG